MSSPYQRSHQVFKTLDSITNLSEAGKNQPLTYGMPSILTKYGYTVIHDWHSELKVVMCDTADTLYLYLNAM